MNMAGHIYEQRASAPLYVIQPNWNQIDFMLLSLDALQR